ncbi:hypothetical protein BC831DRAFT_480403 [Entophlyctis helioformis]|nr:hypothetical protein BC831DRAFT_480403 [Entophlyctis helioformis]
MHSDWLRSGWLSSSAVSLHLSGPSAASLVSRLLSLVSRLSSLVSCLVLCTNTGNRLSTTAWQPGRARWSRHSVNGPQCRPLQQGTARRTCLTGHSIEHQHTPLSLVSSSLVQSRPVSRVWRSALSILLSLIRPNAAPLAGCWPMHPVRIHTHTHRPPSHASTPYATGLDALPCLRCGSSSSHLLLDRIIHCAWLIARCSPIAPSPL